ncbi:MAG: 2-phospho-L-lactate/phosphoenolpyruvate guanylyltransferase [Actinomycetota bacterium]|jgi:2-phospho-L-lactate guanylyltransferase|nr:2-phospho-L-lactate/phosphoenolpyruvate guanylyltransferase [Actinomycetota bacterium]
MTTAVLLPVKGFSGAKARLSPVLGPQARADLARDLAERVVAAARPLPITVVTSDRDVMGWADMLGLDVTIDPGGGLSAAVTSGVAALARRGVDQLIVAHGDLPMADDLSWLARFGGITLVPDRREDGTNVICLPTTSGFTFSYGPDSFGRHRHEARRLGLPLRIVRDPSLGWDIDFPADLEPVTLPV